jgi:predicted HicB family RNase H-like nuclease
MVLLEDSQMGSIRYKGYEGSVESDAERNVLRGRVLFISDLVTYEATDKERLQKEFEAAVDDYVTTCLSLGRHPQTSSGTLNENSPRRANERNAIRRNECP